MDAAIVTPLYSCRDSIPLGPRTPLHPTAFIDRDGVLNVDKGYVSRQADFEWIEGAREATHNLRKAGFRNVVITNQSGIGRGYYKEQDFLELMQWMLPELAIDAVFYCACAPESGCPWRKPGTGMLEAADIVAAVDRPKSFLVGDKESDLMSAQEFGIRDFLFKGENLTNFLAQNVGILRSIE